MSTITSTAAAPVVSPAPLIWPERDIHAITSVDLNPSVPASVEPLLPQLRQLAALGDALRALQALDGSFTNDDHARLLAEASAQLMREIADSGVPTPAAAELIHRRADALAELRHDPAISHAEAALTDPQPLTVIAGPFCTYRNKTRAPLHSVIVTTANPTGDELVTALDTTAQSALASVNARAGTPDVSADPKFAMLITDLIAMGGESNAFPKHFTYFLPEDVGAGYGDADNKTILFRNVYGLRYEKVSKPLGEALLRGPQVSIEADVTAILVTWMRGHDIAHDVTTPRAGKIGPKHVGHEPWYSLQEAIADAYGTAIALTPEWLGLAGCTADELVAVYLAEALHYVRRGPWNWSDAGAAHVELSFLAAEGFIDVAADGTIAWETERVVEGIHQLCAMLEANVVSAEDPALVQRTLERYAWRDDSPIATTVRKIRDELGGIPTSIAYL
jgi:hypothetical protein